MRVELEIQWLEKIKQWALFFRFDKRVHLILAEWKSIYPGFSYEIDSKQKDILRGKLRGLPCKIRVYSLISNGYIDNCNLFFLNKDSYNLIYNMLLWLPSEKRSKLIRQNANILIGSKSVSIKDLMNIFLNEHQNILYQFLKGCISK